ncbi:MAG: hypothetical protein RL885_07340 [Planctomycetota bacterium]
MILAVCLLAVSIVDLDAAEDAYRQGRFEEAARGFEAALETGAYSEADVLFNLGNCAYRLDRLPHAVWYYRRASSLRPDDEEARFNLQLTERRLAHEATQRPWLESAWRWLGEVSLWQMAGAFLAFSLLGLMLVKDAGFGRRLTAALCLFAGLVCGAQLVVHAWLPPNREAVVLSDACTARLEPHSDLPPVFELEGGDLVEVHQLSDRWALVGSSRGEGWVPSDALGLVESRRAARD